MKYSKALLLLHPLCLSSLLLVACGTDDKKATPPDKVPDKVNTAPMATKMVFATQADTTYTGKLTGSDAEMDSLTFTATSMPTQGTLTLQGNGSFTYVPNADVTGSDKFSFTVADASSKSSAAEVNITIDLLPVTFSDYSRKAFTQTDAALPVSLNSRNITVDDITETAYDDLLMQ